MSKKAGFARLQKMNSFDEVVEMAAGDERLLSLDRFGPKAIPQTEMDIPIAELHAFPGHPFKVIDDDAMQSLSDSIRNRGVLHPIVVRKTSDHGYEIISGHRRRYASAKAGLKTVPAYVLDISDEEATILMADANFYQRDGLLPSEKAKAYRMKSDAIQRHQGSAKGRYTMDEIGEGTNDSATQIKRYIRLSYLSDEILDVIDNKKLGIEQGVQLSYISPDEQMIFYDVYSDLVKGAPCSVSPAQAKQIREASEQGTISREFIISVLLQVKVKERKFVLSEEKLMEYFPEDMSDEEIENIIIELLQKWKGEDANG